jgi:hypothetical protein
MAQQSDDLAILSRAFEDALTDLLLEVLMEGGIRPANEATAGSKPLAPPHGLYRKGVPSCRAQGCSSGAAVRIRRRFASQARALRARHRLSVLIAALKALLNAPHSSSASHFSINQRASALSDCRVCTDPAAETSSLARRALAIGRFGAFE